jgi:hypothetical protein
MTSTPEMTNIHHSACAIRPMPPKVREEQKDDDDSHEMIK